MQEIPVPSLQSHLTEIVLVQIGKGTGQVPKDILHMVVMKTCQEMFAQHNNILKTPQYQISLKICSLFLQLLQVTSRFGKASRCIFAT